MRRCAALDLLVANEHEAAWLAAGLGCAPDARGLHAALGIGVAVTHGGGGGRGGDGGRAFRVRPSRAGGGHHRRGGCLVRRAGRFARPRAGAAGGDAPGLGRRGAGLHPAGCGGGDAAGGRKRNGCSVVSISLFAYVRWRTAAMLPVRHSPRLPDHRPWRMHMADFVIVVAALAGLASASPAVPVVPGTAPTVGFRTYATVERLRGCRRPAQGPARHAAGLPAGRDPGGRAGERLLKRPGEGVPPDPHLFSEPALDRRNARRG